MRRRWEPTERPGAAPSAVWARDGYLCSVNVVRLAELRDTPLSVDEVVRDLRRWQGLGIQRVMLQYLDIEDLDAIELVAREVIPAVA